MKLKPESKLRCERCVKGSATRKQEVVMRPNYKTPYFDVPRKERRQEP